MNMLEPERLRVRAEMDMAMAMNETAGFLKDADGPVALLRTVPDGVEVQVFATDADRRAAREPLLDASWDAEPFVTGAVMECSSISVAEWTPVLQWLSRALKAGAMLLWVAAEKEVANSRRIFYSMEHRQALDGLLARTGFEVMANATTDSIAAPSNLLLQARRNEIPVESTLQQVVDVLEKGDIWEAQRILSDIAPQQTSVVAVREMALLVAVCHELDGRPVECLEALEEVVRLDPTCVLGYVKLAEMALSLGDATSAQGMIDTALQIQGDSAEALRVQRSISQRQ